MESLPLRSVDNEAALIFESFGMIVFFSEKEKFGRIFLFFAMRASFVNTTAGFADLK